MHVSKPLPRCDAMEELIKTFFDAGLSFDTTADSILGYIDALDNIPASTRLFVILESPPMRTMNVRFVARNARMWSYSHPVLPSTLFFRLSKMPKGIGRRIHDCIAKTVQKQAMLNAEDAFKPIRCLWNGFSPKKVMIEEVS